tara:strand:+ start:351 stop:506 length:156 start_codon:yes stop_codon:yes gene_type:complete
MDFKFKIDPQKVFKVFSGTSEISPFHYFTAMKKLYLEIVVEDYTLIIMVKM